MTKAILNEDLIIKLNNGLDKPGVELQSPIPSGVPIDRVRIVDGVPVDLATVDKIWVRNLGGQAFELHAIECPGCQLVPMTYADRKFLISEDGAIRVKTFEERDQDVTNEINMLLKNQLRQTLKKNIGDDKELIADLFKLNYLLLNFVLTNDPAVKTALEEIKTALTGVYDVPQTKERLLAVSNILKGEIPSYYLKKK